MFPSLSYGFVCLSMLAGNASIDLDDATYFFYVYCAFRRFVFAYVTHMRDARDSTAVYASGIIKFIEDRGTGHTDWPEAFFDYSSRGERNKLKDRKQPPLLLLRFLSEQAKAVVTNHLFTVCEEINMQILLHQTKMNQSKR